MALLFLDTNSLLRHLLADHPDQSSRATAYLDRLERGEFPARLSDLVVCAVVFTLQRQYRQPKATIRAIVLPLLELPGIVLPGKRRFRKIFDLYVDLNIAFADAYHAVMIEQLQLTEVVSFDREFDRVPGLTRREP